MTTSIELLMTDDSWLAPRSGGGLARYVDDGDRTDGNRVLRRVPIASHVQKRLPAPLRERALVCLELEESLVHDWMAGRRSEELAIELRALFARMVAANALWAVVLDRSAGADFQLLASADAFETVDGLVRSDAIGSAIVVPPGLAARGT